MALPASELERLVFRGGIPSRSGLLGRAEDRSAERESQAAPVPPQVLSLGGAQGGIDAALPDGGLPRGAVVEVASVHGLARMTTLAVGACAAAQRASRAWSTRAAWCAWLDPWGTLHAPALRASGVELERLLVVRPTPATLARTAVRVVASSAFSVVVVDTVLPLGLAETAAPVTSSGADTWGVRLDRWPTVVRRLALAVEGSETTVLLLTDLTAARGLPLPVAMRIELEHRVEHRVERDGVERDGVERDGVERDGVERDGVERDRVERDGVERDGASTAPAVRRSYLRVAKERQGRVGGFIPIEGTPFAGALRPALRSATSGG